MYLDPRSASRIDSREHSLGVTTKAIVGDAKNGPRSKGDDCSSMELGHISVERRWEVDTDPPD